MALASAGTLGHHYNCNGSRIELGGELLHVRHAHLRSTLEPMLFAAGPGDGLIGPAARNLEQRHPDPLDFGRKSGPGKNYPTGALSGWTADVVTEGGIMSSGIFEAVSWQFLRQAIYASVV
ncbi:hypothetical protein PENDEC_c007G02201 [Penicillium decumbens]|uniref:Uncharacterized protein n=1 Tax=Penicillium decumbens TaxID=69771 RepID=A0A1V6PE86_PENDC|nr:hypothetical protein PENDEC_c007G02201 [Penicillium decumbens]